MPSSLIIAAFKKFELYNIASRIYQKTGIIKKLSFLKDPLYLKGNYKGLPKIHSLLDNK